MLFPVVSKQKTAQAKLAVPVASNASEVLRFQFDTPSPDDSVFEAQKRATGSAESSQPNHQTTSALRPTSSQPQPAAAQTVAEGKLVTLTYVDDMTRSWHAWK